MKSTNLSKQKRDEMIKFLEELKKMHNDDNSIRAFNEIENELIEKKFGLVFEEHREEVDEKIKNEIPILCADETRKIEKDKSLPYNFIIEGDNLQALYLLEKTHRGKIDCIYIDPPYNTGARDWKYNNDYVDSNDNYRHSKWLSMMKSRLQIAKKLLNPECSVLICTIDEKEYLHLGCLLEECFVDAHIQMVSINIHPGGVARKNEFARSDEYAYFVFIGNSGPQKLKLSKDWLYGIENTSRNKVHWRGLMRSGRDDMRTDCPNLFYPIFVSEDGKKFMGVGDPLPLHEERNKVKVPKGQIAIFPIHLNGSEGRWQCSPNTTLELQKKGYIKLGGLTARGMAINYLAEGERKKVEEGLFKIVGKNEDGSLILDDNDYEAMFIPTTQWQIKSHDALRNGANLINQMLCDKRFDYPKSVYAVMDTLKFIINDNKEAIVLDFFAGSGTTLHAVNLLNAIDGGKRKCIMVTNNELSEEDEKNLKSKGIKKGSQEWENLGIAKYVTWPRTVCSINGTDIKGKPISGNYGVEIEDYSLDEEDIILSKNTNKPTKNKVYLKRKRQIYPELSKLKMKDGFPCNVKYFKCDWIPRKPEDYLLSNVLCLHIKEMIELENAIEVDNEENVMILNKDDFKKYILDEKKFDKIKRLWVNQNVVFDSEEMKILNKKEFKYIPKEYFGQELKEAAE